MSNNYRALRVAQELQREVNDIIKKRVNDPRVQDVTITDIRVTGDLSQATIYYSILSDLASEAENAQKGLEKSKGTIKRELGSRLTLYKIPDLFFERDTSVQEGNKIDQLLRELNNKE